MDSVQRFLVWQWGQPTTFTMNILFLLDLLSFFSLLFNDCLEQSCSLEKNKKSPPKLADVYWYCWWQYIYTATKSSCSAEPALSLHPTKMNAHLKALKLCQQTEWETKISLLWHCAGKQPQQWHPAKLLQLGSLHLLGNPQCPNSRGFQQPNLSAYNLSHHCRGRKQGHSCSVTHRHQQQVHNTGLNSLLGISSCFVHSGCYTKLTGSCTRLIGNSTVYYNLKHFAV